MRALPLFSAGWVFDFPRRFLGKLSGERNGQHRTNDAFGERHKMTASQRRRERTSSVPLVGRDLVWVERKSARADGNPCACSVRLHARSSVAVTRRHFDSQASTSFDQTRSCFPVFGRNLFGLGGGDVTCVQSREHAYVCMWLAVFI